VQNLIIRQLGTCDYQTTWDKMKVFVDQRDANTPDEVWLLEHPPVFTQGLAGKPEHVLNLGDIPLICTDRGGQVTYHGPGQLVAYTLFDLQRLNMGSRQLVQTLESCVIDVLASYGVSAESKCEAPGVYIEGAKICSIGLRVRKGCSYHGIAFNIDMDLTPFSRINPCGFKDLQMTQLRDFVTATVQEVGEKFGQTLAARHAAAISVK
jgi:lipoyl(octanoyl) transferase